MELCLGMVGAKLGEPLRTADRRRHQVLTFLVARAVRGSRNRLCLLLLSQVGLKDNSMAGTWSSGLRKWLVALAAVFAAVVGLFSYACPRRGEQSFSVEVRATGPSGADAERRTSVEFTVKNCVIEPKSVWCSLSVLSKKYDRDLILNAYNSQLVDNDGDAFHSSGFYQSIHLERNVERQFKMEFAVNKDIALPARVIMNGSIDGDGFEKSFEVRVKTNAN
jgi:hypothetical protein